MENTNYSVDIQLSASMNVIQPAAPWVLWLMLVSFLLVPTCLSFTSLKALVKKDKLKKVKEINFEKNRRSDRSMEVKLPGLLGNYDKQTDQPTDKPTFQVIGQSNFQQ